MLRHDRLDALPTVFAINQKIRIKRQNRAVVMQFRHADKAGIRKRHRHVGVFSHQRFDLGNLVAQMKWHHNSAVLQPLKYGMNMHFGMMK